MGVGGGEAELQAFRASSLIYSYTEPTVTATPQWTAKKQHGFVNNLRALGNAIWNSMALQ